MARYWNGYQWRELAEDSSELHVDVPLTTVSVDSNPKGPFVMEPPKPMLAPAGESLLARSTKPTRRELQPRLERAFERHHVHEFVNDVCECGATEGES